MNDALLGVSVSALALALMAWWRAGRATEAPAVSERTNRVREEEGDRRRCGICRRVVGGGMEGFVQHFAGCGWPREDRRDGP